MANPQGNPQNLIPVRSKKEAKNKGQKGGKASGIARRQRKTMREQLELLFSLPVKDPKAIKKLTELGIDPKEMDNQMAMQVAMMGQVLKGNVKAYEALQNTVGQNPKIMTESEIVKARVEIVDDIGDD